MLKRNIIVTFAAMIAQFLIGAPWSGSGKTTLARGLMSLLTRRGLRVQPFKCGPDYIDTKFHEAVCGRPSVNLDTFMATPAHVKALYSRYSAGADVCVVEGMMGLFDGYDRDLGSSAEIARLLGLPVVLVVDARSAGYSMAALLKGFVFFRQDMQVAGVIFNKVGSERHAKMLREVCDDLHLRCLGCVPRRADLEQDSRYLGLDFSRAPQPPKGGVDELLGPIADALMELGSAGVQECRSSGVQECGSTGVRECRSAGVQEYRSAGVREERVFVARNAEAFSFLYQETLDSFADVTFFDPERDVPDLEGCELLYLPGGYPEKHLEALVGAEATRHAIRDYAERGGRVVAECGGMMYLCDRIVTDDGEYPMCGVLPYTITARKADRHLSLGYRHFELDGREYRGHEFHYTQFLGDVPPSACQVFNAKGEPVPTPVFKHGNVLASYTHLYQL